MLVSSQAAGAQKAVRQPSISSSMLQAAVTTAQWPITTLAAPIAHIASSIGESSKGLLSVPADLARTGARMGTGLVMVRSAHGLPLSTADLFNSGLRTAARAVRGSSFKSSVLAGLQ